MGVPEKLAELEALGSADAIATYAWGLGIKAIPCEPCACAVAELLRRVQPDRPWSLHVFPSENTVTWTEPEEPRIERRATLPLVVAQFAVRFDNGAYPDLEVDL